MMLTEEYIDRVLASNDRQAIEELHLLTCHPYYAFEARPNVPADFDEQTAFWEAGYHFDERLNRYVYDEPAIRFKICLGGTGCLSADQPVYVHGRGLVPVGDIDRPFITASWDGAPCLALANSPFLKGYADVFRYVLSDGSEFLATAEHRVLTVTGRWLSARCAFEEGILLRKCCVELESLDSACDPKASSLHNLDPWQFAQGFFAPHGEGGEALRRMAIQSASVEFSQPSRYYPTSSASCRPSSISGLGLLSCPLSGRHLSRTGINYPDRYFASLSCHGERPRLASICGLSSAPLRGDALGCSQLYCCLDGPGGAEAHNRLCRLSDRHSTTDSWHRGRSQRDAFGSRVSCIPSKPAYATVSACSQSALPIAHPFRTTDASAQQAIRSRSRSPFEASGERVAGCTHIVAMERIGQQPFYDFTVHGTHCYIAAGVIHHNSGKTVCAAHKTAKHVLETRPPEVGAKFWVISHSLEQVGAVCWKEKLSGMIPENEIYAIAWANERRGFPSSVMLKHPDDYRKIGWVIEFKSYEQGLASFTGANIGGYWFNEEVPFDLVAEVMGRTRQWGSPGWADFTPIECRDQEWPEKYNRPPADWRFYHLNSRLNFYNAPGWYESQKAHWPDDTVELRTIGKFTALHGAIFKEFRRHIHAINWDQFHELTGKHHIPRDWRKVRGIDFGYGNPFCCLWAARNKDGTWFIYDEHYRAQAPLDEHARCINSRPWDSSQPWYGPTYSDHDSQDMAELGQRGIQCQPAVKHKPKAAIDYVRSLMMLQPNGKPRLYILEDCRNLLKELPAWKWKEGTDGRDPRDEPIDKDDHSCDALLYALYSDHIGYQKLTSTGFKKKPNYGRRGVLMPGD